MSIPVTVTIVDVPANGSAIDRLTNAVTLDDESRLEYFKDIVDECAKKALGEVNDNITRNEIEVATHDTFMQLLSAGFLTDFAVICDEAINTPTIIDANEFCMTVAVQLEEGENFHVYEAHLGPTTGWS